MVAQMYIRTEPRPRYHRVVAILKGALYVTMCARVCTVAEIRDSAAVAPALCHGCRSRMAHPYLIPPSIAAVMEATDRD